jgi:hypothetical protein
MSNASTNVTTKKVEVELRRNTDLESGNSTVKIKNQIKTKKPKDDSAKDEFGITHKLSAAINQKYEVLELIGNGSYGCVS